MDHYSLIYGSLDSVPSVPAKKEQITEKLVEKPASLTVAPQQSLFQA
jgi:hypothetical protein